MSNSLIKERRFLPYFCTQFLGAFNDNIYRNAFAILVTYVLVVKHQGLMLNFALIAFILPFFLFGAIAGQFADKYDKAWLIRRIKIAEILIMLTGCLALYFQSVPMMLGILFALGAQSAFFGPIKYSILPQHLREDEILRGNAYVEAGTFIAILLGTIVGGYFARHLSYQFILMSCLVGFAVLGWWVSRSIPSAPAAAPDLKLSFNIWSSTVGIVRMVRANPPVFLAIIGISWFWFISSIILTQFPAFAEGVLRGDATVAVSLLATFSIGIGIGSWFCSVVSGDRVELGVLPFGALGISYFTWQLGLSQLPPVEELRTIAEMLQVPGIGWVVFNMVMLAFSSGLFIVPLYTFMQVESNPEECSRTIAVNNIINSAFMVVAGISAAVMLQFGLSVLDIFVVTAVANLIAAFYIIYLLPNYFLRLISWILVHSVYRIKKNNVDRIPATGPALIVANHAGFVDPAILLPVIPRPARFVMFGDFYNVPIAKSVFKALKTIPIMPRRLDPELFEQAFDQIAAELEAGKLVVVFPEGGITEDSKVRKFQPGIEQIIKRTPVPVVPIGMHGVWGTWSSRHKGRAFSSFPTAFMKRITVSCGEPVSPQDMNRIMLRDKVLALIEEAEQGEETSDADE